MASQVLIRELGVGAPFQHVKDEGNPNPQPERVFRVVAFRASTAIVENGVGVRTSMSKKTAVLPVGNEVWEKLARPSVAAPIQPEKKAGEEKAAG